VSAAARLTDQCAAEQHQGADRHAHECQRERLHLVVDAFGDDESAAPDHHREQQHED
jgi:hypothetical protein